VFNATINITSFIVTVNFMNGGKKRTKWLRICSTCSIPGPFLIHGCVARLTRRMSLLEQELLTLPEHLQWPKEKGQKNKQRSTKHTHQTKNRVNRTQLKTERRNLKSIRYKRALTSALVKFSLKKSYFHFFISSKFCKTPNNQLVSFSFKYYISFIVAVGLRVQFLPMVRCTNTTSCDLMFIKT
jgi:hypothetical protein